MMELEESKVLADQILRDAGWTPVRAVVAVGGDPIPNIEGRFAFGNLVCGHPPEGSRMTYASKELTKIPQARAHEFGFDPADYPDEHHEAAAWLVEHAKWPNNLTTQATLETPHWAIEEAFDPQPEAVETPAHESDGETGEANNAAASEEADRVVFVHVDATGGDDPSDTGELSGPDDYVEERRADPGLVLDADFTIEDLGTIEDEDADLPALDAPLPEDFAPEEIQAQPDGPIAYGASTIDGLIREKLGRVSQIARELKAIQQEGWTLEEFAYLQNLMVRMDRGEAPDDQASRERFLAIAAKSQAMSRIDAVRDRKEGELEEIGQRRDFDAAVYYEPGEGWP